MALYKYRCAWMNDYFDPPEADVEDGFVAGESKEDAKDKVVRFYCSVGYNIDEERLIGVRVWELEDLCPIGVIMDDVKHHSMVFGRYCREESE